MNRRIACIASHVPDGCGMIDVGTDHGYLPLILARRGYPGQLFASDIREGPLAAARRTAAEAGLEDRICFSLCDGLTLCDPERIDCIVIAGMGGDTIAGILDRAEWCMDGRYTLVLQPMTRAEVLRYWLIYNDFEILDEDLTEDGGTIYSVITARFGGVSRLSDAELYTGSLQLLRTHPLFRAFLREQIARFEKMLRGMQGSAAAEKSGRLRLTREILTQLRQMEES